MKIRLPCRCEIEAADVSSTSLGLHSGIVVRMKDGSQHDFAVPSPRLRELNALRERIHQAQAKGSK